MALELPDTVSKKAEMKKLVPVDWEKPCEVLVEKAFPDIWKEIKRVVEARSNQREWHENHAQTPPPMEEFEAFLGEKRTGMGDEEYKIWLDQVIHTVTMH